MSAVRPGRGKKKRLCVYLVRHEHGHLTGVLVRRWDAWWDVPAPAAYGISQEDVLRQLEVELKARQLDGREALDRYLWNEEFVVRSVSVPVAPQTTFRKQTVVGKRTIPLRLSYTATRLSDGGYRLMLPRFGWWIAVEDLDIAASALQTMVSGALLGERPRWLYDFRPEVEEYVIPWSPGFEIEETEAARARLSRFPAIEAVADDLVARAARRKLPRIVGTSPLLPEHLSLVMRTGRAKRPDGEEEPLPSILLVGGPGVGKTAWVHDLARQLGKGRSLEQPDAFRIWRTSSERLIAGMVYLGQWQERMIAIVDELRYESHYLYVDRLPGILKRQPDGTSIADMLLPALAAREIALLAECSDGELERCRQLQPAILRHLQVIRIHGVARDRMPELLAAAFARKMPDVAVDDDGLRRVAGYLDHFQPHQMFPGKGLRFVDWLASSGGTISRRRLHASDMAERYSRYTGLPVDLVAEERPLPAATIASSLSRRVVGQAGACASAARVLARFKAGLNDPEKPVGTLLFVGPTGVGKTELARQVARTLYGGEKRLHRFDMSEYQTPGSAVRLLASGRGVRSLAELGRQEPLSVVLLDEIEKADPGVFDLLLGVLGEGRLTDDEGRLVDLRMAIFVLTSNLGSRSGPAPGFAGAAASDVVGHVRRHFRPELCNRLDEIVAFRPLDRDDVLRIADIELALAAERAGLVQRNLRLAIDPEVRAILADAGFDPLRGARPLKRVIEERLVAPLAALLAAKPRLRDREIAVVPADASGARRRRVGDVHIGV